jgi:sortase A
VYVFSGIEEDVLTRGPGWYPTTARPGKPGNTAIAGHRTGYGSPFAALDELHPGDTIDLRTPAGDRRTYRVDVVRVVETDDVWVLGPDPMGTGTSTLTLTTCDPPGVNTHRLVVIASLIAGSSPA